MLPELLNRAKTGGRVRIWSAASSDGQEPYSIALTVLSMMPNVADYDFKILATDIDPKILNLARAGCYDDTALETGDRRPCASSGSRKSTLTGAANSRSMTVSSA